MTTRRLADPGRRVFSRACFHSVDDVLGGGRRPDSPFMQTMPRPRRDRSHSFHTKNADLATRSVSKRILNGLPRAEGPTQEQPPARAGEKMAILSVRPGEATQMRRSRPCGASTLGILLRGLAPSPRLWREKCAHGYCSQALRDAPVPIPGRRHLASTRRASRPRRPGRPRSPVAAPRRRSCSPTCPARDAGSAS